MYTKVIQSVAEAANLVCQECPSILPPRDVIATCHGIALDPRIDTHCIGTTEMGREIHAFEMGSGPSVLLYGFPDPGESTGGTGIVNLMYALLKEHAFLQSYGVRWCLIPCLNLDDQPDDGKTIQPVMRSAKVREVDWCVANPRSETTALLQYVRAVQPAFSFPLHDECHCGEAIDMYFPVTSDLPVEACDRVRALLSHLGVPISTKISDPTLGAGFFKADKTPDFTNSTFATMAQTGPVFIAEVSLRPEFSASQTVATQLGVGLIALASCIEHTGRGTAPRELFAA